MSSRTKWSIRSHKGATRPGALGIGEGEQWRGQCGPLIYSPFSFRNNGQISDCDLLLYFPFPPLLHCSKANAFFAFAFLVGASRFERPTPCSQGRCATWLRYAPSGPSRLIVHSEETISTPILTMIRKLSRIVEELKWFS